jgi:hypothetical protein
MYGRVLHRSIPHHMYLGEEIEGIGTLEMDDSPKVRGG